LIPVPARIVTAAALALAGTWTISDLAFTVGLFTLAVLFAVWAAAEVAGGDS
jgi:hypothetical protein